MKVIDLLNKIANGETKEEIMFQYNNGYEEYVNINKLFDRFTINEENLNTEIEITEEDKNIEKLETYKEIDDEEHYANILKVSKNGEYEINEALSIVVDKINEIIEHLNKGE